MPGRQRVPSLPPGGRFVFSLGVLLGAAALLLGYGWGREFLVLFSLFAFLLRISLLDMVYGLIFDRLLLPFAFLGLCFSAAFAAAPLWEFLVAGILAGGALYLLRTISRGGMGGGDVKFAFCLGLWLGPTGVCATLFLAFFTGGIFAAFLLLFCGRGRKDRIAFGPFLALGAFAAALFTPELLAFYGGLFR